jgi:competence ComEA-like helix-hairpin-helix protein
VIAEEERKILSEQGLIIAFDQEMMTETLSEHTFQVLIRHDADLDINYDTYCYCNVRGHVTGVKVDANCEGWILGDDAPIESGPTKGARFIPMDREGKRTEWISGDYLVVLKGDFILGEEMITLPDGREVHPALDADHLAPGLLGPGGVPPRPGLAQRCPTGDWVEGGTFESWFTIVTRRTNINTASFEALVRLPGIGPELADAIIANRPFVSVDKLIDVAGIGPVTLNNLRHLITVG